MTSLIPVGTRNIKGKMFILKLIRNLTPRATDNELDFVGAYFKALKVAIGAYDKCQISSRLGIKKTEFTSCNFFLTLLGERS